MTVAETFENLQTYFNPAAAAGLDKTIQLNLTGNEAGAYAFRIVNQTCTLISGGVEKADLTMTMSDQIWLAVVQGQLDAMNAFVTGKIKATGDMMLAMRIPNLFKLK